MDIPPLSPGDINLQQSQLMRASLIMQHPKIAADSNEQHSFTIQDIRNIFIRFQKREMSWDDLQSLSISNLSPDEKNFILYLRRNPTAFGLIAKQDGNAQSLSLKDIETAINLLKNTAVIDLNELEKADQKRSEKHISQPDSSLFNPEQAQEQIEQILEKIQQQQKPTATNPAQPGINNTQWVTLNQLKSFKPDSNWSDLDKERLDFLNSPTVQNLLKAISRSFNSQLSPEVIRILTSLIWNPTIYSANSNVPLMIFESRNPEEVEAINPLSMAFPTYFQQAYQLDKDPEPYQSITLSAKAIRELCKHLKLTGGISLKELRNYQPINDEEKKLLRYLNQQPIFQALAHLDGKDNTLDPKDIQIALDDKVLVLSDEHIRLVFTP